MKDHEWSVKNFWAAVNKDHPNGCWVRAGWRNPHGYTQGSLDGKKKLAHRIAYELTYGPVPEGHEIDHLCRNRACCNPDHLEAVTRRENQSRSDSTFTAINREKTHCPHGHPYNELNTLVTASGYRRCRWCNVLRKRRRFGFAPDKSDDIATQGKPRPGPKRR